MEEKCCIWSSDSPTIFLVLLSVDRAIFVLKLCKWSFNSKITPETRDQISKISRRMKREKEIKGRDHSSAKPSVDSKVRIDRQHQHLFLEFTQADHTCVSNNHGRASIFIHYLP